MSEPTERIAVFINHEMGPSRSEAEPVTTFWLSTQDLDDDGSYQILVEGYYPKYPSELVVVERTSSVSSQGFTIWRLVEQ